MTRFPKPPITPNIIPVARVPRSFNIGRMLVIVTLFAILFSLLQTLDAPAVLYPFAGVFTAAIVLGQMFLFHGEQPRVASLLVGACLMPVLEIGFVIAMVVTGEARFNIGPELVCVGISAIFSGGFLGYLIGTVCAGAFLIVDRRWDAGQPLPQPLILAEIVPDEEQQATPSDSTSPPDPWWQANDA